MRIDFFGKQNGLNCYDTIRLKAFFLICFLITVPGPADWKDKFDDCGHSHQSPIDIVKSETVKESYSPLKITFDNARGLVTGKLENTGHSPKLTIADSNGASLTGGPLGDKTFELLQFHVHFGCANDRGSEHTLDGKRFSGQVSIRHKPLETFLCIPLVAVKFQVSCSYALENL